MKKSNLTEGILFILAGAVLLCAALMTDSALDSLLIGLAAGVGCSGIVMVCKYCYWSTPQNQKRYEEKLADERIELHDELKTKLRDRSGRYAYTIGLITISVSMIVFSVLGQLEIIYDSRMIVLYLGGYLLFQIGAGPVIFRQLLKKYE